METIIFKKEKVKLLTKGQQEPHENANNCYICKEKIENKYVDDENAKFCYTCKEIF